ncbi:MAG: energy transducer TonB [Bacteroidota bacterium]
MMTVLQPACRNKRQWIALPAILTVMVFFAGSSAGNGSYAQGGQTTQYNQYEAQAGPTVLAPPRHQAPPKDKPADGNDNAYKKLDKEPAYPGGYEALFKFILANVKYPSEAMKKNLQGKVLVSFNIATDGSVANVAVKQGLGSGCDEEAVRVINLMPKWKPGEKDGNPVQCGMILPIQFKLDEKKPSK